MEPTVHIAMGSTEPSTAPNGIPHMSIKELSDHTTKHWAKLLADLSCPCHQRAAQQNAIFCSRSHCKNRISHANLDEVTCCRHLQLPCRRDNSALHHSQPGTTAARLNRVCESPCQWVPASGQAAGVAGVPSKFVPEENRSKVQLLVPL